MVHDRTLGIPRYELAIFDMPTIRSLAFRIGETDSETTIIVPASRLRTVS